MEEIRTPSVREILASIEQLKNNGKTDAAMNMAIIAANQARISYALTKKVLAEVSLANKDTTSARAYFTTAIDLLHCSNIEEKIISDSIKEQLSKLV